MPVTEATCGASSNSVSPMPQPRLRTRDSRPAPVAARIRWTMCAAQLAHGGFGEMPLREAGVQLFMMRQLPR